MGIIRRVRTFAGHEGNNPLELEEEVKDGDPNHVCQSCGEEYYTRPDIEIDVCRACGGVKVEAV